MISKNISDFISISTKMKTYKIPIQATIQVSKENQSDQNKNYTFSKNHFGKSKSKD